MNQNKYQYKVQGVDYDVEIEEVEGNLAKVNVNGISFEVELKHPINPAHAISHAKVEAPKPAPAQSKTTTTASVRPSQPAAPAGAGAAITAPLPGTITAVQVKVGDKVNAGDTVIVLEAMKMQNNIEAENAGTVTSISVNQGDSVMEGAVLLTIA
ncbi:MAG: biotin/lipoyl-binding protein [Prevotella sp.]|nr:biotin/lipoyl-binding protein [Prevotella sp.]